MEEALNVPDARPWTDEELAALRGMGINPSTTDDAAALPLEPVHRTDDRTDTAPAAVPTPDRTDFGPISGEMCNTKNITQPVAGGVADKLADVLDKLPEQFTEAKPIGEAVQKARRAEAVRRARANDRKREAERKEDWKAVAKASGNKPLFIQPRQMLGMFRDYFDALAADTPVSASSVIQSWFPDKHETVRGKNWLKESIQTALMQLQYHPVATVIKECEMFGAVEYRQAADLDRIGLSMARVRRMYRASVKLKQQDNDIAELRSELRAHVITSDAEIAELKRQLAEMSIRLNGDAASVHTGRQRTDTVGQKQQARNLKESGMSFAEVAKALGVGKTTVQRWLNPK